MPTLGLINYGWNIASAGGKLSRLESGDFGGYAQWCLKDAIMYGTGYDMVNKVWDFNNMWSGTLPIVIGAVASKVLTWLGVNRYMAKIPLIGKRVKF